jgi:hypothetical protein
VPQAPSAEPLHSESSRRVKWPLDPGPDQPFRETFKCEMLYHNQRVTTHTIDDDNDERVNACACEPYETAGIGIAVCTCTKFTSVLPNDQGDGTDDRARTYSEYLCTRPGHTDLVGPPTCIEFLDPGWVFTVRRRVLGAHVNRWGVGVAAADTRKLN